MTNKTKIFTMADLSNSNPLTLTERKMLIKGCMTVLLEEDDRLSNLGMLLSKFEETVREKELDNQQLRKQVAELAETQEPVARINVNKRRLEFVIPMDWSNLSTVAYYPDIDVYTTQPSREWVGLSDAEIEEVISSGFDKHGIGHTCLMIARAIEAKLREKQNGI